MNQHSASQVLNSSKGVMFFFIIWLHRSILKRELKYRLRFNYLRSMTNNQKENIHSLIISAQKRKQANPIEGIDLMSFGYSIISYSHTVKLHAFLINMFLMEYKVYQLHNTPR